MTFPGVIRPRQSAAAQFSTAVSKAGPAIEQRLHDLDRTPPRPPAHGVIKPGKPTILAVCEGKPVFGLPGNPVSAMVVGDLFITPTLWKMQGCERPPLRQTIRAKLSHNLASVPGRVDYIQVKLIERAGQLWAEPIFGKSNLIYTLVKADGMMIIPGDANGIAAAKWWM